MDSQYCCVEAECEHCQVPALKAEIDRLKQMMWEAYAILGFDTDGDETYHARVGWPDSNRSFLDACREFRRDYDEALDEIP